MISAFPVLVVLLSVRETLLLSVREDATVVFAVVGGTIGAGVGVETETGVSASLPTTTPLSEPEATTPPTPADSSAARAIRRTSPQPAMSLPALSTCSMANPSDVSLTATIWPGRSSSSALTLARPSVSSVIVPSAMMSAAPASSFALRAASTEALAAASFSSVAFTRTVTFRIARSNDGRLLNSWRWRLSEAEQSASEALYLAAMSSFALARMSSRNCCGPNEASADDSVFFALELSASAAKAAASACACWMAILCDSTSAHVRLSVAFATTLACACTASISFSGTVTLNTVTLYSMPSSVTSVLVTYSPLAPSCSRKCSFILLSFLMAACSALDISADVAADSSADRFAATKRWRASVKFFSAASTSAWSTGKLSFACRLVSRALSSSSSASSCFRSASAASLALQSFIFCSPARLITPWKSSLDFLALATSPRSPSSLVA
mmetsp:Transcript_111598/g.315137  ORF Transcript_111598/g.315137 Transcript_111598/m.315137 type:complete len:443 (-) Transcript_111598:649-1977(-)